MSRTFTAKPAVREHVPLLIGLIGPSGGGKTKSALLLAEGIRSVTGGEIYGIDTEARRMAHYAAEHRFHHVEFDAPFGSLDYLEAIRFAVGQGAKVVIVDSMSHEHEGPGGMIDFQERELDRMAGTDFSKRERMKMLAWQKPKAARRALINGLLQVNCNFIFCFRAREKTKPIKTNGKSEVVPMGFMPIAGDEFLFEMTVNCLLLPKSNGVPTWQSDQVGERLMMKRPGYLADIFPDGQPLSPETGKRLAQWAAGSPSRAAEGIGPAEPRPSSQQTATPTTTGGESFEAELEEGREAAKRGAEVLRVWWQRMPPRAQHALKSTLESELKPTAAYADRELAAEPAGE